MDGTTPWARFVEDVTIGATQKEIAAVSGIPASVLSRWISGRARPSAELAIKLARAYKCPPAEALVAAGYLEDDEVQIQEGCVLPMVGGLSDVDLVAECDRQMSYRARLMAEMSRRLLNRADGQPG